MAFTYDPQLDTSLDQVRFRIGDTDPLDPQLQDEELNALLATTNDNVAATSLLALDALIARYARFADKWVGDLKILAHQRYEQFAALRDKIAVGGGAPAMAGIPTAGGVYIADKVSARLNTSLVQGAFRTGMHDNV